MARKAYFKQQSVCNSGVALDFKLRLFPELANGGNFKLNFSLKFK
jgi:hypothetical protein